MGELDLSKDQREAGDATSLAPGSALAWRRGRPWVLTKFPRGRKRVAALS